MKEITTMENLKFKSTKLYDDVIFTKEGERFLLRIKYMALVG